MTIGAAILHLLQIIFWFVPTIGEYFLTFSMKDAYTLDRLSAITVLTIIFGIAAITEDGSLYTWGRNFYGQLR